jgi:autotransporter-associated beta strand protein
LTGSSLTIGAGGVKNQNALHGASVSNNISLSADQTWEQDLTAYSLDFYGDVDLGGRTLTAKSEYPQIGGVGLWISGNISGDGGSLVLEPGTNISIGQHGASHTYTGMTTIRPGDGNVHVYMPNPFTPAITNDNNSIFYNIGGNFTNIISGMGSVSYNGQQTYSLRAPNVYTGGTLIGYSLRSSQATSADLVVQAYNDQVFGSGDIVFWYDGGTLQAVDGDRVFDNQLILLMLSTASARFIGSNSITFARGLVVDQVAGPGSGPINIHISAPVLKINGEVSTSPFSEASPIIKSGVGSLSLSGNTNNTFRNDVVVSQGALVLDKENPMMTIAVPDDLMIEQGGTLTGIGIVGDNVINEGGVVRPGRTLGLIDIGGDYKQLAGGRLIVEIGGTEPSQFDALRVRGDADLAGILEVSLVNGFRPRSGDTFEIVSAAGGRVGSFDSQSLPAFNEWEVVYRPASVLLHFIGASGLPGDYNDDGTVDAADYVVWREGLNNTYTQTDYDVWRENFGKTIGTGTALTSSESLPAAIPEPRLGLIVVSIALTALLRQRRITASLPNEPFTICCEQVRDGQKRDP